MRATRSLLAFVLFCSAFSLVAAEPTVGQIGKRFDRAEAAIESGEVDAESDLAPLIALLSETKDEDNLERVISRISDLGESDGSSPVAVKRYLLDQSTPLLIGIAENRKNKWSLRGEAIHALRDMGAPRAVLQRVADMALADPDDFVKSRGEILQNFISSMPAEGENAAVKPTDAAREHDAIAFLKSQNLGVSLDQLRLSSIETEPEQVTALIAAGVDPNAGDPADSPLNRALSACAHQGGETESVLATVDALLAGGASVKAKDANANTPMISAAQYCGEKVIAKLIAAGAEVNIVNGSGITPLQMALIMSHVDAAEALVNAGARLTADQAAVVSASATSDRAKAVIRKATGAKKKK